METNFVSLWLGNVESEHRLKELTKIRYSDDGDFEGSEFSRAFKIGFFDEQFSEADCFPMPSDGFKQLLKPFSCSEVFIPQFEEIAQAKCPSFNAAILLYNMRYHGEVESWQNRGAAFQFIGATKYQE